MSFFQRSTSKLFSSPSPPQVRKSPSFSVSIAFLLNYYCLLSWWYKKLTSRVNETPKNFSAMAIALQKIENRQSVPTVPPQGLSEFRARTFTEATPRSAHSAPVLVEQSYCTFLVLILNRIRARAIPSLQNGRCKKRGKMQRRGYFGPTPKY